jgi:hypothetical protein
MTFNKRRVLRMLMHLMTSQDIRGRSIFRTARTKTEKRFEHRGYLMGLCAAYNFTKEMKP